MKEKKKVADFDRSEPEFLISCIDRHKDWGVVVCLVGGGQEINTGEAGIQEWVEAIERSFPHWHVHISDRLTDEEFGSGEILQALKFRPNVFFDSNLHLSVNRRSYRSENVSNLVKHVLDVNIPQARDTIAQLDDKYP